MSFTFWNISNFFQKKNFFSFKQKLIISIIFKDINKLQRKWEFWRWKKAPKIILNESFEILEAKTVQKKSSWRKITLWGLFSSLQLKNKIKKILEKKL